MDQTQLNSLDPKLKEAYDRIMGTAHAAAAQNTPVQSTPKITVAEPDITGTSNVSTADLASSTSVNLPSTKDESITSQTSEQATVQQSTPSPAITTEVPSQQPIVETPAPKPVEQYQTYQSPVPAQVIAQPSNATSTQNTPQPPVSDAQMQTYIAEEVAGAKQSLKMIQLIYIAGGIIFFVLYALFWMRFFQIAPL